MRTLPSPSSLADLACQGILHSGVQQADSRVNVITLPSLTQLGRL